MKQKTRYLFVVLITVISCTKTQTASKPAILSFDPVKLAAYNYVTIYGSHFDTVASKNLVSFNGQAATVFKIQGDSVLVVVVPQNVTPGKITVTVNGVVSTSESSYSVLAGSWIRKADVPDPVPPNGRVDGIGFAIGNTGYIGLGTNNGETFADLYAYDPATNQWTAKSSLPVGLLRAFSMVINGKAYVGTGAGTGANYGNSKLFFEYDPSSDKWTPKGDFPGGIRKGASAFSVVDKGYAGLGENDNVGFKDWWQYNPSTDNWIRKSDFPGTFVPEDGFGFTLNGKIYIGGSVSLNPIINEWWQYDPAIDAWTKKKNMPWGCDYLKGVVVNNIGYLMAAESWQYDDVSDSWTQKATFGPRNFGSVFSIGNKAYYGTGLGWPSTLYNTDFWEYTPD